MGLSYDLSKSGTANFYHDLFDEWPSSDLDEERRGLLLGIITRALTVKKTEAVLDFYFQIGPYMAGETALAEAIAELHGHFGESIRELYDNYSDIESFVVRLLWQKWEYEQMNRKLEEKLKRVQKVLNEDEYTYEEETEYVWDTEDEDNEALKTPIEDFGHFSRRVKNILLGSPFDLRRLGDLMKCSRKDLRKNVRNVGPKVLDYIEEGLAKVGLSLRKE